MVALVVVELPTTRSVIDAIVARSDEKNPLVEVALVAMRLVVDAFVIVALVVVEFPTMRFVMFAIVARRLVKNPLVAVMPVVDALPRVVCPVALRVEVKRFVAVTPVVEAFPKYVCPETVSEVAEALPKDEVPEVSVENTPVVNDGLADTEMVLVPENMMLAPATRLAIGLL
jgi:hypothetical protein